MKRECISTLFISSYLWALSCLITLKMLYLKCVWVWCKFEIFWKRLCLGKLCNDSRLYKNVYKVLVLKNSSMRCLFFWRCVESLSMKMVLICEQATTSVLPTQKVFVLFLLFYMLLSYHWLVRSPIIGCEGTGVGQSYSHRRQPMGRFSNVVFRD